MRDRRLRVLPGAVALALLAACTGATAGSATSGGTPTGTPPSSGSSQTREQDRYGAPRVANPLDVTRFLTDPCAAIPPAQQPSLGFTKPGEPDTTSELGKLAPSCDWSGQQGGRVSFLKGNRNGLADLYRSNASSPDAYWEETTVEGYPAVFHGLPDARSQGHCKIAVGLNDALAMGSQATGRPGSPVCERAKQMAAVAVRTIKEAG